MTNYTHAFINHTNRIVPLSEFPEIVDSLEVRVSGFLLVDKDRIELDQHGVPCYLTGGWSYGHVQGGYICAGAGGLNSLRVAPL